MTLLRSLLLIAAIALTASASAAVLSKVDAARTLISQGHAQSQAGNYNDALASYRAAVKADPAASEALSYLALLMVRASQNTEAKYIESYRAQARDYANAALKVDARDPNAMEALRQLEDGVEQRRRAPAAAAIKAVNEGELLFGEGKYAAAALKYEQAILLDPGYADAVVFLGDCYYVQGDMARAEQKFRQATVMDPQYGAAWRYLYDALRKQDKRAEAEAAAFGALAAMPSALPNWLRVVESMELAGPPLAQFKWQPRAAVKGTEIQIDPTGPESDGTAWTAYGLSLAAADAKLAPFARELATWTSTLQIISELGSADKIQDPGLRHMIAFHKGGQLKAALFALHYKEAYRAEFEAWKKAEPDGLKRFVETFRVAL
jgi:tetratricopeptide (TPR) repeat protein